MALPYPAGSDPMANTDLAIKALAQAIQYGTAISASIGAGLQQLVNVAFPIPYAAPPTVLACVFMAGINPSLIQVSVESVTAAGCVIRCRNGTAGALAVGFAWVALK